jgi:hypothetical protein
MRNQTTGLLTRLRRLTKRRPHLDSPDVFELLRLLAVGVGPPSPQDTVEMQIVRKGIERARQVQQAAINPSIPATESQ